MADGKNYALVMHVPPAPSPAATEDTISFNFYSDCIMAGSYCASYSDYTSTRTYEPESIGNTYQIEFSEGDIGDISHLYLNGNGNDAYAIQSFDILLDDTLNIWNNCSLVNSLGMIWLSNELESNVIITNSFKHVTFNVGYDSTICNLWSPITSISSSIPSSPPSYLPSTFPSSLPSSSPLSPHSPSSPPSTPSTNVNNNPDTTDDDVSGSEATSNNSDWSIIYIIIILVLICCLLQICCILIFVYAYNKMNKKSMENEKDFKENCNVKTNQQEGQHFATEG